MSTAEKMINTTDIMETEAGKLEIIVGDKLKALRERHHYSQMEIGEKLHVEAQTVSSWELGKTAPDIESLKELGKMYGVSLDYLLGLEDIEEPAAAPGMIEAHAEKWKKDFTLRKNVLMFALAAVVVASTAIPPLGLILCISTFFLGRKWHVNVAWLNVVIAICLVANAYGIFMLLNMFVFDFGYSTVTPL